MRALIVLALAGCARTPTTAPPTAPATSPALQEMSSFGLPRSPVTAWVAPQSSSPSSPQLLAQYCTAMFDELEAAYGPSDDIDRRRVLEKLLADPPELPSAQLAWCRTQLLAYVAATLPELEREARATMRQINNAMAAALVHEPVESEPSYKLCPSATRLPSALPAGEPVLPAVAEWKNEPGWRCLRVGFYSKMHFQYEVRVDARKQSFVIIARRLDLGQGVVVEISGRGRVDPAKKHIVLEPFAETRVPPPTAR